jgi:hypothetical protein
VTAHRFALAGVALPGMDDLFGVWEVPSAAAVSFDAPTEPAWRVQLSGSLDEAWAVLERKSLALSRSESSLVEAERRLSRLAAREGVSAGALPPSGVGGASYGVARGPEAELLRALQAIEAPASFGPDWREGAERREVFEHWRAFLDRVSAVVAHYARVETEMAGALVGRTTVGWTGDFDVHWGPGATTSSMALHREAVRLALGSRIALVRLLIVVGTGAAKLGLRLTVPGAQLLVLPAAWKFVRDVLQQLREWQEVG